MGVPGSGKTALAHTLKNALEREDLNPECADCMTPVDIIDEYVPEIEQESGLALGFDASYLGNLQIALGRAQRERKSNGKTRITCGSVIETSTYVAIDGVAQMQYEDDAEREDSLKRIEATMKMLACMYMDTFRYDYVFYLPPLTTDGSEKVKLLDRNLQTAFRAFAMVPAHPLMVEGDNLVEIAEKRCALALMRIFDRAPDEG